MNQPAPKPPTDDDSIWLRALIEDRSQGVLLDSTEKRELDGSITARPGSFFRSPSGGLHRYYVDVGALCRDSRVFPRLVRFAGNVLNGLEKVGVQFDTLVAANPTASYLSQYLHPHLDRETEIELLMWDQVPALTRSQLDRKRILIVLDAFAYGRLTRDLIAELQAKRAVVIGLFAVVHASLQTDPPIPSPVFNGTPQETTLYSLASFPIEHRFDSDVDEDKIEDTNACNIVRRIILDRRNGMLLDARNFTRPEESKSIPAFELYSGRFQQYFVTIWGIFDKPWYFAECVRQMSALGNDIRQNPDSWFNAIVTCTATAKHLVAHLQRHLESHGETIDVFHLGPYPFHTVRRQGLLSLRGQSVLIVTDVVASTKMVRNIASAVERLGGTVKAILAVAQLFERELETRTAIELQPGGRAVPIRSLTDLALPALSGLDNVAAVPVDPTTVLPIEPVRDGRFSPCFNQKETIEHLTSVHALRCGLYESDGRLFSAAVRVGRLLREKGEVIWKRLRAKLEFSGSSQPSLGDPEQTVLVTTYGREDMHLQAFFQRWAALDGVHFDRIFIPRSDSIDSDFPFFLARDVRDRLEGKAAILLLSSLHTSEKLRKLVSLLAQNGVSRITVVCLLNRMGKRTVDFVSRIERLAQGVGRSDGNRNFSFIHVFNINDLHGTTLTRTLQAVEALAFDYCERTPSPIYKSLIERELRYFRAVSISQLDAAPAGVSRSFEEAIGAREPKMDREAWLYGLVSSFVTTRDVESLVAAMDIAPDRRALYMLYTCLLSEISYLRLVGGFQRLKKSLVKSILQIRGQRLETEFQMERRRGARAETAMRIRSLVSRETNLLFGLALFSYLDHDSEAYSALATDLLQPAADWSKLPLNFEFAVGGDRYLWCMSLLFHFTRADYRLSTSSNDGSLVAELRSLVGEYVSLARSMSLVSWSDAEVTESERRKRIVNNLASFVTDLGFPGLRLRHQTIRFLHSRVLEPGEDHNPVIQDIRIASDAITSFLTESQLDSVPLPERKAIKMGPNQDRLREQIDSATNAAALLEGIAAAVRQLFGFHPLASPSSQRYMGEEFGFSQEVERVRELLQHIRTEQEVAWSDSNQLQRLFGRLSEDLTLERSELVQALLWYIVPFKALFTQVLKAVDEELGAHYGKLWEPSMSRLSEVPDVHVLGEPPMVRQILRNLLSNVRHVYPKGGLRRGQAVPAWNCRVEEATDPEDATEILEYLVLTVSTPEAGSRLRSLPDGTTLDADSRSLAAYAGSLAVLENPPRGSNVFELRLLLRNRTMSAWQKRLARRRGRV